MDKSYVYLWLNILTIAFPLAASWDNRFSYNTRWKFLFPSILLTGIFFLIWDVLFTSWEVWGFNPEYLTGYGAFGLPLEEYLFFLTVPFSCVFIYEVVKYYKPLRVPSRLFFRLVVVSGILLGLLAFLFAGKIYTMVCFGLASVLLIGHGLNRTSWLGRFMLTYCWTLIPFALVNGVLTALPVVWYDDQQNLGLRLGSIPLEDTLYSLSLLLMVVSLYEFLPHFVGRRKSMVVKARKS